MITLRNELFSSLKEKWEKYFKIEEFNLFGIQFSEDQNKDIWNDILGIFTFEGNVYTWMGTTDPGKNATENKEGGVAHLCLGFHKNIWGIGMHPQKKSNWQHLALVQRNGSPCKIWRDTNRDYECNDKIFQTGYFGINFHRAALNENVSVIGPYGEGCQVTLDVMDFNFAMNLIMQSNKIKSNPSAMISYLLLDHKEMGV